MPFRLLCALPLLLLAAITARAESYSFGVLNQRSSTLTARYWNPILAYVGQKAGITLTLAMGKDVQETYSMTARGEFDFLYSNHIFQNETAAVGYKVILRPDEDAIQGQIVVNEASLVTGPNELAGKEVGFPSASAFAAYALPMDFLARSGIQVKPVFGGNQEGVMAQLKSGAVVAAAVNSAVMRDYAARTGFRYRAVWSSQPYLNLPIAAHPRVPAKIAEKVRQIMDQMDNTPDGHAILQASAEVIRQPPPYGFKLSSDKEYANYRTFYKETVLKDMKP